MKHHRVAAIVNDSKTEICLFYKYDLVKDAFWTNLILGVNLSYLYIWTDSKLVYMDSSAVCTDNSDQLDPKSN